MAKKKTPFEKKFGKMQDNWDAGLEESGFSEIPAGIYSLQLQSAELRQSESSQKWMFMRKHLITEGEFAGESVVDFMTLEGERSAFFCKMWIEQMGMEAPAKFTEVPGVVEEMVENHPKYTGQVIVSDEGYTNVRIKKLLEGESALDEVESSGDWGVGDRVVVQFDGEPYAGEITEVDDESADVTFDNGDEETVAKDDLEPEEEEEEEEETQEEEEEASAFEVGARVLGTLDGDQYPGEVSEVDGENVSITFDDGDEQTLDVSDVEAEEEEETTSEVDEEEEEQRAELLAFCQAQSVAGITDESSVEDLTAAIKKYEWAKSDLIKEEVELLEGIGAKWEKAKPKTTKKKAAKKKSTKKTSKKTSKKKTSKKAGKKKTSKKKK